MTTDGSDPKSAAGPGAASPTQASDAGTRDVDPKLLEILVCPITKGTLSYNRDSQELISLKGDVAFPIRDGVPLMTPEAARPLTEAERARAKAQKR